MQSLAAPTLPSVWVGALRLAVSALCFVAVLLATGSLPQLRRLPAAPMITAGVAMAT